MNSLETNKKFYNKYINKECYLFGNGSSIKYIDLDSFKDKHSIVCTWMFLHKDFKKLNVVADYTLHPYYFSPIYRSPFTKKISLTRPGKEMIKLGRFDYNHPVFISETNRRFFKKKNVHYIKHEKGSNYMENKYFLDKETSISSNSLFAGIGIAQYFGFKKINLVGFDYITEESINGHFYEKSIGWKAKKTLQDLDINFLKKIKKKIEIQNISINENKTIFFKNKIYKNPSYKENYQIVEKKKLKIINKIKLGYKIFSNTTKPQYFDKYVDIRNKKFLNFYFKKIFKIIDSVKNFKLRSILWRILTFSYYILSKSKKLYYFNALIKSYVGKYNVKLYWHNKHYYNPSIMNWDYLYIIYKNIAKFIKKNSKNKNKNINALDIGASVGSNSMIMSKFFRQVHAFEPSRDCSFILQKNLQENKIKNVKLYEIALSDFNGQGELSSPNIPGLMSRIAYGGRGIYFNERKNIEKISVRQCNQFLEKKFGKKEFDFIKLDCEGSELTILKNLNKKLKDIKIIQVELNFDLPVLNPLSVKNFLSNRNFKCIFYGSSKLLTLKLEKKETKSGSIEIFAFNKRFFNLDNIKKFVKLNNLKLVKINS